MFLVQEARRRWEEPATHDEQMHALLKCNLPKDQWLLFSASRKVSRKLYSIVVSLVSEHKASLCLSTTEHGLLLRLHDSHCVDKLLVCSRRKVDLEQPPHVSCCFPNEDEPHPLSPSHHYYVTTTALVIAFVQWIIIIEVDNVWIATTEHAQEDIMIRLSLQISDRKVSSESDTSTGW